jgi:hypothetical protein
MALDPVTAILNVGNSLIDRLLPDKQANDKAKADLLTMQVAGEFAQIQGQLEVDKIEAANTSIFVAGWRPFIGWVCGVAIAEDMIFRPLLQQVSALFNHPIVLSPLDMGTLISLLMGMLGFGAMRSFDKKVGTDNGH